MEDINDEILAVEKEKSATQEKLDDLLKTKAIDPEETEELNKLIRKTERKLKSLVKQLDNLYDMALDMANANAYELFPDDNDCDCCVL